MEEIIKGLQEKLDANQAIYNKEELDWLIQHIGDPSSKIRDNLVCNSLGYGFFDKKFTLDQAKYLFNQVKYKNLLFYKIGDNGIPTLTRSFTCLLLSLFIQINGDPTSGYCKFLNETEEKKIFSDLINYLRNETDFTGYSKEYGWVHAIAHCSDALEVCIKQFSFDQKMLKQFLNSAKLMFNQVDLRFSCGEEYRFADIFVTAIKLKKLSTNKFISWVNNLGIDSNTPDKLYQFYNLKSFCLDIYVKLNDKGKLDDTLKQFIKTNFSEVY